MKPFISLLLVPFFLFVLTAPTFASDVPTLDDTMAEEMTTPQPEAPAPVPLDQAEATEDTALAAEPAEPVAGPAETVAEPAGEATPILVSVTEMVIAKAVAEREPVEPGTLFAADTERLYCHSRIASIVPATITHVWYRDGERVAEIPLQIGAASSWRTWSSKAIVPPTPAAWRVEILAEDGTLLAKTDFTVE